MVNRVFITNQFLQGIKQLKKDKKFHELNQISEIVKKLENQEIVKQHRNHRLTNSPVTDIHIAKDVILLYKYDNDNTLLQISLELNNITDHKNLSRKASRKEVRKASDYREEKQSDYDPLKDDDQ